jgi:subtilisin family serine protease
MLDSIVQLLKTMGRNKGQALTRRQFIRLGTAICAGTIPILACLRRAFAQLPDQPGTQPAATESAPATAPLPPRRPLTLGTDLSTLPDPLVDDGTQWKRDQSRLVLAFERPMRKEQVVNLLQGSGLVLEDLILDSSDKELGGLKQKINFTDQFFWVRSTNGKTIRQQVVSTFEASSYASIAWIGPVYQSPNTTGRKGLVCAVPNLLQLTPSASTTHQALARFLSSVVIDGITYQLAESLNAFKSVTGRRQYQLKAGSQIPVYKILQYLRQRSDLIREARLTYFGMVSALGSPHIPTDLYYSTVPIGPQWNMDAIEAHLQINAGGPESSAGWAITKGNANIVVAVIDAGCDLRHPDLLSSWAPTPGVSYQFGDTIINGNGGELNPLFPHGTKCAGIIAATHNNGGVAGLAPLCKILPIALYSNGTNEFEIANAIEYAMSNGARVISMSFGVNSNTSLVQPGFFSTVKTAIDLAFQSGVVLCAAAMNAGDDHLWFPAEHPNVIACGASNQNKNRCTSSDWAQFHDDTLIASNFGSGVNQYDGVRSKLSVVAPGVGIPTTTSSCDTSSINKICNYVYDFAGTSAATPHVAALAALILSLDPSRTPTQVRFDIETSAQKTGGYTYMMGWNPEVGYGLIDVRAALCKVNSLLCRSASDITPPGVPENLKVQ